MTTITWFLEDKPIWIGPIATKFRWGEPYPHWSLAYYCPKCGNVWAMQVMAPDVGWTYLPRMCKRHGPPFLLSASDETINDSAPLHIWAREFLIAYELYTKQGSAYDIALLSAGFNRVEVG